MLATDSGRTRKILSLVLILALTISAALANGDNDVRTGPDHAVGTGSATVEQDIRVYIPYRFALHITDTVWNLNLSRDYYINKYCRFVSKYSTLAPDAPTALSLIGRVLIAGATLPPPAAGFGYPAIRPNDPVITDHDKGYLFCFNRKVVQKFANDAGGWRFTVSIDGAPDGGFGVFAIADRFRLPNDALWRDHAATTTVANGEDVLTISIPDRTTYGWLNNHISEGFFFDGSEVAGDYDLVVTYTLAGL